MTGIIITCEYSLKQIDACSKGNIPMQAIIKTLLEKKWTETQIRNYVGPSKSSHICYAQDEVVRTNAASGGSITALLISLFTDRTIDGVLVCRNVIRDGSSIPEFYIATDSDSLMASQGSKYSAVKFSSTAIPLIKAFSGTLAVVALPCDISLISRQIEHGTIQADKIRLLISLFCGHNSEPDLTSAIIQKLNRDHGELVGFRYRAGHWRGKIRAQFQRGEEIRPFSFFSDYQNLYFFSQRKCHHCIDHTGFNADMSFGDIWSIKMKASPIKHNGLIVRTERGEIVYSKAIERNALFSEPVSIEEILDGQARTLPFHYNITARSCVGKLFGEKISPMPNQRVRWHEYLTAFIVLGNERISRSNTGRWVIFHTPRFLIKMYLYLLKGLESL